MEADLRVQVADLNEQLKYKSFTTIVFARYIKDSILVPIPLVM